MRIAPLGSDKAARLAIEPGAFGSQSEDGLALGFLVARSSFLVSAQLRNRVDVGVHADSRKTAFLVR
jgi:hypothetical protein